MEIIAFIGRAGSGKDYQCSLLEKQGFKKLAFADALRDIAFSSLQINKELGKKFYEELKSKPCINVCVENKGIDCFYQFSHMNFRQYLEQLGTQGIRKYDNDFWVKCLIKTIEENKYEKVCISDMRFINEYYGIKEFANKNKHSFRVIFCDYKSNRYQSKNEHESAKMSNYFAENGYKDLQEIDEKDVELYKETFNE